MKKITSVVSLLTIFLAFQAFATNTGEISKYKIIGDTIYVNNHICASSHSPMEKEALGIFTSKVKYNGTDPLFKKFKGKTLVFNQCCEGCIQAFPKQWADGAEEILAFHGLDKK